MKTMFHANQIILILTADDSVGINTRATTTNKMTLKGWSSLVRRTPPRPDEPGKQSGL